jgi:hypothetical protein
MYLYVLFIVDGRSLVRSLIGQPGVAMAWECRRSLGVGPIKGFLTCTTIKNFTMGNFRSLLGSSLFMMKNILQLLAFVLVSALTASLSQAQVILHENFNFPEGTATLGNLNGWQADFNNAGPSAAPLHMQYTMQASTFGKGVGRDMALHPDNSTKTSYKKLPELLNGKNIFFSFSMKAYFHQNESVLTFRANDGMAVKVGFLEGLFAAQIHKSKDTGLPLQLQQAYFIVGQLQISEDGRQLAVAASVYTSAQDVKFTAPTAVSGWQVFAKSTHPEAREWAGVGFINASASAAFDDLRIGETWFDVTGRR